MNKKKTLLWGALLFFLIAIIAGCGQANENSSPQNNLPQNESPVTDEEQVSEYPITIVDGSGTEKTIEQEPETIVSLLASSTEIAFALGLGDKVIGVSDYCNYPEAVHEIEKLGAQEFNTERILEVAPDLLLVSLYHHQAYEAVLDQFETAGIAVVVVDDASSFEDTYEIIDLIGEVGGAPEQADQIIGEMKNRFEEIKELAQNVGTPKQVWIEVGAEPDIFTTGQGTFMHEMLEMIQAVNVAGDQEGWVSMTEEEIVSRMPEVILLTYGEYTENAVEKIYERSGWGGVPAIVNNQVFEVNNDSVTRPGPRLLDGVEDIARKVYPEIFE